MKNLSPISVTLPHWNISELDSPCNCMGFFDMKEVWKDIKGYEGIYQISNLGKVKSFKKWRKTNERLLNPYKDTNGYYYCNLYNSKAKKKWIHRLVYQAFCGELIKGMIIDHIDNNCINNLESNLQQITKRENESKDQFRHNRTSKYVGVHFSKNRFCASIRINGKSKYLGRFISEEEASQAYQDKLKSIT